MFFNIQYVKPVLIWLIFTVSAVALYCGLFLYFPERALYDWYSSDKGFVDEFVWVDIYMSTLLALTVLLNCIFILTTTLVYKKLTRKKFDDKAEQQFLKCLQTWPAARFF